MLDASTSIELEAFEQIEAVPGRSLLRLTARAAADLATNTLGLVIDAPDAIHRLDPLPSPPEPSGLLRIAFSAPDDLIAGASAYRLELVDGSVVELPLPTQGTRKVMPTGALTGAIAVLEQELEAALESARRAREEVLQARAETDAATMLANQWQLEAERAQEAAGRALEEMKALRAVAATATVEDVPADEEEQPEPEEPEAGEDLAAASDSESAGQSSDESAGESASESAGDSRYGPEREFAERQAANREVLRRARALEREQTPRRASRRKPAVPKPPRPDGPTGRGGGAA